jgi:hypothetical protein
MLTNSCVKLQTVHNIPLTINKEGETDLVGTELPPAVLMVVDFPSEGICVCVVHFKEWQIG